MRHALTSPLTAGPLCEFATVREHGASPVMCRMQGMGPAGAALRMRRPAARGALRCSPWGRAAELASLTAFVALEQLRRVSLRSARVHAPTPGLALQAALGASAQPLARHEQSTGLFVSRLASSPSHTQPGAGRPQALRDRSFFGESVWQAAGIEPAACRAPQARNRVRVGLDARLSPCSNKEQVVPRQAVGGWAGARLCGGEEHRVSVGARTRALRELTRCDCPSVTNAVSEASFAARPKPEDRSEVGAPSAPTAAVARQRTPARGLAPASTSTLRTFKDRKGPKAEPRFMCHGSRHAWWSN